MITKRLFSFVVMAGWAVYSARAEVTLPPMFSEHMVLQQGMPVPVWGWAEDGEVVTVKFRGQKVTATTQNKEWRVTLKPLKAGGPDTFAVTTRAQTLLFTNVLVGEVWVCSGQSNMEWPMNRAYEPAADIASATNARIRLLPVPKNRQESPTVRIRSAWQTLSPQTVDSFSAVGYYFGRALERARHVPVGLIGTYWGGTPAEAWMDRESLEIDPRLRREILEKGAEATKNWRAALQAWERDREAARNAGEKFEKPAPYQPWAGSELYYGMVHPLTPLAVRGAIWYQGESNASRAEQYRSLFADMIRCWRRNFDQPELPFLCVQLAPFKAIKNKPGESDWAELREAQLLSTQILPKAGMAVITDVGEEKDIHPRKKAPVGERLALAARGIAYGEKIEYSGPAYKSLRVEGNRAVLTFDHAEGLEARGGELKGFAICGEDRKWVWGQAAITGPNTVTVTSPEIAKPVAVRFGWADYPVVNLWNKAGLPASPFRTDDFPLITQGK